MTEGPSDVTRADRLRLLLAMEVARIVVQTRERLEFMVTIWSRHRSREPFLDTLFTRYRTAALPDLLLLEGEQVRALESFYAIVDDLRLYLTWTDDMPVTLHDALEARLVDLTESAEHAITSLRVQLPEDIAGSLPLDVPEGE